MSLTWKTISSYLMTSTSILGVAVGTPAFIAAATGTITWRDAALPLLGSVISLVIPQRMSPPADAAHVLVAVDTTAGAIAKVEAASPNPTVRGIAAMVPAITQELESAFADYQAAASRLNTAKVAASSQAASLTASLSKATIIPATIPTITQVPTEADKALLGPHTTAYTPAT
jgi:hypothetical protein